MKGSFLIGFVAIFFVFTQADCKRKKIQKIRVYNESDHSIFIARSYNYPDTTLSDGLIDQPTVPTHQDKYVAYEEGLEVFDRTPVFQVFFIDADSMNQKGWNYIKTNNIYLSRKEFTEQQIINADYSIYFP